jgi:hypothetical protein
MMGPALLKDNGRYSSRYLEESDPITFGAKSKSSRFGFWLAVSLLSSTAAGN